MLFTFFSPLTEKLHDICLSQVPTGPYQELYQAMICAEDLKSAQLRSLFVDTGLYHLIVVSGSHLVLIGIVFEKLLMPLLKKNLSPLIAKLLFYFFLATYALVCCLQPPLVRALIAVLLSDLSRRMRLGWSEITQLFLTILICIALNSHWVDSMSLLLSAVASLALIMTRKSKDAFRQQCLIYLILMPPLLGWGNLHPSTIFSNFIFAPLISIMLLPAAISCMIFPFLQSNVDSLTQLTIQMLEQLRVPSASFNEGNRDPIFSNWMLWIYFICMGIASQIGSQKRRQT